MTASGPVKLEEIQEAGRLLKGVAVNTAMNESRWLADRTGAPVFLKCENLQRTGSFKIRGAYTRMSRLSSSERARGVVAASAGNHAQGVALAAQMLGIQATVFMPEGAPINKLNATLGYGATVELSGANLGESLVAATEFAHTSGAIMIHPFDHVDIMAGQGTAGIEIVEQAPTATTVVVPTGGGGFLGGVATAIKSMRPDIRVVGVQAEEAAAYPPSLASGQPVPLEKMSTMADGIAVPRPGDLPFAAISAYVDEIATVSEESISRALVGVLERDKMVVEPAGAVAVAALLDNLVAYNSPTVAVLSGGNVDPLLLGKLIRHGLASAGRYLNLRVKIPDLPGGLAALLTELAAAGANILEVTHQRTAATLSLDEVEVAIQIETRGQSHAETLMARLGELGYEVRE